MFSLLPCFWAWLVFAPSSRAQQLITENVSEMEIAHKMAALTYDNQKRERDKRSKVSTALAVFPAQWPCFWGEEATGDYSTWEKGLENNKYTDGWKFTCGLRRIVAPCVVYSMGSCGNMAFEKGLLQNNPACEIHIFDKNEYGIEQWFPKPEDRKKVHFHRVFIGDHDDNNANPPVRKLSTIMKKHKHTHIDILKMDIEGEEWPVLQAPLPSVGQLLAEVHLGQGMAKGLGDDQQVELLKKIFNNMEDHGLRLFHKVQLDVPKLYNQLSYTSNVLPISSLSHLTLCSLLYPSIVTKSIPTPCYPYLYFYPLRK